MQKQQCFHCAHWVQLVHVHGHYQSPVCGINLLPCCDGDNCDTNQLLQHPDQHMQDADPATNQ